LLFERSNNNDILSYLVVCLKKRNSR